MVQSSPVSWQVEVVYFQEESHCVQGQSRRRHCRPLQRETPKRTQVYQKWDFWTSICLHLWLPSVSVAWSRSEPSIEITRCIWSCYKLSYIFLDISNTFRVRRFSKADASLAWSHRPACIGPHLKMTCFLRELGCDRGTGKTCIMWSSGGCRNCLKVPAPYLKVEPWSFQYHNCFLFDFTYTEYGLPLSEVKCFMDEKVSKCTVRRNLLTVDLKVFPCIPREQVEVPVHYAMPLIW